MQPMNSIIIPNFPMPPSLNRAYQSVWRGSHSAMIATPELRKFKSDVDHFRNCNPAILVGARELIQMWIAQGFQLRCDLHLMWPRDQIFTKTKSAKSALKRLDADNRLKAGRDGIAGCLNIDDTYFVDGRVEKAIQKEGKTACAIIVISKTKIRNLTEILESYKVTTLDV